MRRGGLIISQFTVLFFTLLLFKCGDASSSILKGRVNYQLNKKYFRRSDLSNSEQSNPTQLSSYDYNRNPYYTPAISRFPTIPYTPGVKQWRIKNSKPRYSRVKNRIPILGSLENLSSKILASNIVVFGLQTIYPSITQYGAKVSSLIQKQPHRLFTPMFLHGGVGHLAMNSYSLMNIGPHVESLFGSNRFLATYIVSGVAGNLLSAKLTPNPSVGASGAIFGLIGAYYVFLQRNSVFFGSSGERGMSGIQRTLVINLIFGASNGSIDNWGHVGGALGGAAMSYLFGPKLYLMDCGAGRRVIVDKPIYRLPELKGQFDKINLKWRRAKRKMQVDGEYSLLPGRPWEKLRR